MLLTSLEGKGQVSEEDDPDSVPVKDDSEGDDSVEDVSVEDDSVEDDSVEDDSVEDDEVFRIASLK